MSKHSVTTGRVHAGSRRPRRRRAPALPADQLDVLITDALVRADVPLSAYDLADALRRHGRHVVIVSIYRALERLCALGAIEKVEMRAAFRIRDVPRAALLICVGCGETVPIATAQQHEAVERLARKAGFAIDKIAIEVAGLCEACQHTEQA